MTIAIIRSLLGGGGRAGIELGRDFEDTEAFADTVVGGFGYFDSHPMVVAAADLSAEAFRAFDALDSLLHHGEAFSSVAWRHEMSLLRFAARHEAMVRELMGVSAGGLRDEVAGALADVDTILAEARLRLAGIKGRPPRAALALVAQEELDRQVQDDRAGESPHEPER